MTDQRMTGERPENGDETKPVLTQPKRKRGRFNRPILTGDDWYVVGISSFAGRGERS